MMRSGQVSAIIGGNPAHEPIPWQVHIHITREDGTKNWCGGTILDQKTILSAAHCFDDSDKFATIEAGFMNHEDKYWEDKYDDDNDYYNLPVGQSMQTRVVNNIRKNIIRHPNYDKVEYLDSDIAIVKLASPLRFTDHVQPAWLPDPSTTPDETGQMAVASGWGITSEGNINKRLYFL